VEVFLPIPTLPRHVISICHPSYHAAGRDSRDHTPVRISSDPTQYESVLHQTGFERIVWHAMQVSPEGFETYGRAYWQAYLTHPHIVVLDAQRRVMCQTQIGI